MIREFHINGFRAFSQFFMRGLGRINLLVGGNNSGKSSVLEAIQLLASQGDPHSLWFTMSRRGERIWDDTDSRPAYEADVRHLFFGHELYVGNSFRIKQFGDAGPEMVEVVMTEAGLNEDAHQTHFEFSGSEAPSSPLALHMNWHGIGPTRDAVLPVSRKGGLSVDAFRKSFRPQSSRTPLQLITTASLSPMEVVSLLDDVMLTPDEDRIIEALRTIEPTIERIATAGFSRRRVIDTERGGVVVKCSNNPHRIPIGSMGDGIWRMLGLALALVRSENGILLVDEIDTGLHYSVMEDMWRLLFSTAQRLNVQVFATTHSRDCYESLAVIAHSDVSDSRNVTIQRIEREKHLAVAFSEKEIVVAAQRGLEVR
ncbi:MAG: AAA family ATPase [Planctomycetaceae bacterium]|nr:AAA family ATPase [Planctomycetaceae bacterium]